MTVRGWLIVGGAEVAAALPQERDVLGTRTPVLPPAGSYPTGSWLVWEPTPWEQAVTAVLVEVPV